MLIFGRGYCGCWSDSVRRPDEERQRRSLSKSA